jgi:hypothetical protein
MPNTRRRSGGPGFNRKAAIRAALDRLQKYFGKTLSADQVTEYTRALRFVPAEALEEIAEQIIDETHPTPGRFPRPGQLLERFYQWQAAHPEKRAAYPKTECPVCRDEFGLLHGTREEGGITYGVVARCAACQNWLTMFPHDAKAPLMRPEDLEAQGYLVAYPRKAPPLEGPPPAINRLTDDVGERL